MKKIIARTHILLTALLLLTPCVAFAWGQSGHNAVAAIAEANLTPKAKATIEKFLGGRSIVYYSVWMDWYRHTPDWAPIGHTAAVDENFDHAPAVTPEKIDGISAIMQSIKALRDYKKMPADKVVFHIQVLVHAVGDTHCPVHVKYAKNVKTIGKISIGGNEITYHKVWDANVVDAHTWGYQDWAHQMNRLSKDEIAKVTAGGPADWFRQSALDCRVIHTWVKPGENLTGTGHRDFLNKAMPLAESQIQKAGYRLAKVLNGIFSE